MKSRINDEKKLSLILRFVILLQSLVLSQSYWRSLHSQPSLSWLGNRVINSDVVSKSWPQFVFETFQTQSLSLSSLALNPKAEALPLSGAPPQRKASKITNGCSPLVRDPICSCYALDEGLLIDCKISAIYQMTDVLNSLISQPIKSFSVHTINLTLNSFPERLFQNFSTIEQIYICLPSLVEISAEALVGLDASLKTLSIVNSKLKAVPKAALKGLNTLSALDLQSNAIREVEANAFSGLPLVSLNLQSNLINSLDDFSFGGLQNSLVELVLIDNKFQSFPVHALQHLTKLEVLKLQTNTISEIRVDGITRLNALKSLDLQSNHFQNLDENSFIITPNLVSLSVANNRLKVLNDSSVFEHLLDLEALDLSYNKLKVIYLNKLIALRTVDLSNNELNDIRLHNVPNLREVFVSNNNILRLTNDTFVNSSSLSVIFLQHNAIQSIDYNTFHSLQHLLTLDLSSNQLKAIDPQLLKYNSGLQSLYLDNNSISVLEPKALDGLEELQQIDLSHNVIRTISPSLLQNLTSLETLHLDSNWLSTIPNGLLHTSLQNFKTLSLDNNPIVRIREDQSSGYGLSALEVLAINDANLSIIASHDLLGFPNLKILSLKNNGIQKLSPSALRPVPTLNELDLSVNRLDVIPEECLSGLVELKLLNISANNLSELPHFSSDLKSVQSLDISYNRVTRVHSFGHLAQSVVYVSVRHNMIGWIANNAFHNLTSLKTIDIRQNFLTQLNEMIFSPIESNLQSLFLSGNPFHCDCRLLSIYEWLESHSRLLAQNDRNDIICAQPEKLKHNSILSLHPIDFCPLPVISLTEISKLESTQVRIKWKVQNDTLVGGFTVEYYLTSNRTPPLTQKFLSPNDRQTDITDLKPENWYTICVEANGKYLRSEGLKQIQSIKAMPYVIDSDRNFAEYVSNNRKCSQVRTLAQSERTLIALSTLGIIVGLFVFVVLMLTLCVLWVVYKFRAKRRRPLKSEAPEEYITYRHFSLPSSENVYS